MHPAVSRPANVSRPLNSASCHAGARLAPFQFASGRLPNARVLFEYVVQIDPSDRSASQTNILISDRTTEPLSSSYRFHEFDQSLVVFLPADIQFLFGREFITAQLHGQLEAVGVEIVEVLHA